MISQEKFHANFERLKNMIPKKPLVFTQNYPKTIKESFYLYSNLRSKNLLGSLTNLYNEELWPLPLWINPGNIRIGFINRLNYHKAQAPIDAKKSLLNWIPLYSRIIKHSKKIKAGTDFWHYLLFPVFNQVYFKEDFTQGILTAFDLNTRYIKNKLTANPLLSDKRLVLVEVFKTYRKGYYLSTITTLFPLLDYLARKHLKVSSLKNDIKGICKQFQQCGIDAESTDLLMPGVFLGKKLQSDINSSGLEREILTNPPSIELGLIGPILSSFLFFANKYYAYYKDEGQTAEGLNRHAILHGAPTDIATKANAVRLITFLVLFIELEPIFDLLFDES